METKNTLKRKTTAKTKKLCFYRIYDDQEMLNYFKSSLTHKQVEKYLRLYEKTHQKYFNPEFISYLKKFDPKAEIIKVETISY
jgi:hypothetical protein